jgi:SNF2 family DNA or RNA helicase
MKLNVSPYQRDAVRHLLSRREAALFARPGLGKTVMTLLTLRALRLALGSIRVLISAPKRVITDVWPEEIEKWDPFDFTYTVLHGPKKEEHLKEDVEIYLINPEGLKWLLNRDEFPDWNILVVDESSQYKNHGSVRFELLEHLLPMFDYRYILTGTPTPRALLDLWSQIYILDKGAAIGKNITHYRKSYFTPINRGNYFDYEIRPGCETVIHNNVAPLALYMDDEEHLDLPDLIYNDIRITLPPKVKKQYESMSGKLFAEIEGKKVFAESAAEKYRLCCDMSSGAIYTEYPKFETLHTAKIDAVKELVGELQGAPLMVVYHRWHEHDRLKKAFPEAPAINGKTPSAEGSAILRRWNLGDLPVLLVQCQSVTHGLNLQKGGHDLVWFSIPDNYEIYDQLNRRLYRRGVEKAVRIHHLVARGTLDAMLLSRLGDKEARQERLFDSLVWYYSNHQLR